MSYEKEAILLPGIIVTVEFFCNRVCIGANGSSHNSLRDHRGRENRDIQRQRRTEGNEGKIECIGFRYSVAVPHDAASGRASGKRQHSPFVIIKNIDYSTPQLLQSAYNNEVLKSVLIEFVKKSADGKMSTFYKVTLTNASISLISQFGGTAQGDSGFNPNSTGGHYEEVSLTFQNIQIDHLVGNTSVVDGWNKSE